MREADTVDQMVGVVAGMGGKRLRYSDLIADNGLDSGGAGVSRPNWSNQSIWTGDNLDIMRGMNSASVDLIYLDPPFNSKADYAAPIGSMAAGAAFKDTWTLTEVDVEWINLIEAKHPALHRVLLAAMTASDKSYLAYMAARLLEMHRLLKPTSSIYLHCDPTMSHYLKLVMDAIFGRRQFRNEIIWHYRRWTGKARRFQRLHDVVLFYSKSDDYVFNKLYTDYTTGSKERKEQGVLHRFKRGEEPHLVSVGEVDKKGVAENDVWHIPFIAPSAKERTGYPTQKPLALLRRVIEASSRAGDTVLDPFCGCATACIAAEQLQREWVGVDISPKAAELVQMRMRKELGLFFNGVHRTDISQRTDLGTVIRYNDLRNRKLLYGEQGGHCRGCDSHFEMRHLEVDHIIAQQKGGTDHIDNLQLLCGHCNRIKGNRGMEYLITKLQLPKAA